MAKQIMCTGEDIKEILRRIETQLTTSKWQRGHIQINESLKKDKRCADLYFTATAWLKMISLVSSFTTEVEWHGLARRISECEFEIYDIVVAPHTVTATTVVSDPIKYSNWLNSLDDETFAAVRFHGHSHVNMGVEPSGTDMGYREDILTQLSSESGDDMFYIFLIINKSGNWSAEIYDITNNSLYDTKEIELSVIMSDDSCLSDFISEAKKLAVPEPPKTAPAYGGYGGYGNGAYGGHGGYGSSSGNSGKKNAVVTAKPNDKDEDDPYSAYYDSDYGYSRGWK